MSELLKGKIAGITMLKANKSNWVDYELSFTDGTTAKIVVPPYRPTPVKGDTIQCKKGQWNKWELELIEGKGEDEAPQRSEPEAEQVKKPYERKPTEKDNYWKEKSDYEENVRDPKIEFQSYFTKVCEMYIAFGPCLAEDQKPSSIEELDGMIDQAFDKAKALYNKANKK